MLDRKPTTVGESIMTIGGSIRIAELAVDKQAQTLLMPVAARRQLNDLPDGIPSASDVLSVGRDCGWGPADSALDWSR